MGGGPLLVDRLLYFESRADSVYLHDPSGHLIEILTYDAPS